MCSSDLQKIVIFEQSYPVTGEPPVDWYSPELMLADTAFSIDPGQEVLALISGASFGYFDDCIYDLELRQPNPDDPNFFSLQERDFHMKLCVYLRNCADNMTVRVGVVRTLALGWVDVARAPSPR